ncbi:sn-glycerol-3-phosphate ABC transporter ATP-binding protein UgpC [Pelagicoccus sp. SDUM812005]|uniref:ABC transporter ATP-binding protein n=1 Tax=Pelagicoccus sp. SDUM812005 TaxID=3041257 RepID=UPI00280C5AD1|nr:sn-glycerol-3-phosphate ABC transporter ATP-binding protein UgpC [Pelagicoccus sp. SDUM812005]MDQ8181738.1 sn-glycerol-3-phosphate ABC transporter ATP-binding protein UgpC [Pelagicoccus sp. SDUM812005]
MSEVTLSNLSKTYPAAGKNPAFQAVKGIDLQIRDREFMVLVGPSGCGKSTTLRMIAGLEEITDGTIAIGETVVNNTLPKDRDIAMVFQNYALYPHMTVYDNMAFGLKLRKYKKDEIKARVGEAASMLGLQDMLDRKPKALSGGQRQRVAVGRAIVRKPKVFLFDEPLSNLDAKMRVSTRAEISKLHKSLDATMIYVTHDQVEAMTMGDRICIMNAGEIMQVDTPLAVYNEPANLFVAGFIGSPPMNLLYGTVAKSGDQLVFQENDGQTAGIQVPLDARLSRLAQKRIGSEIVFGIRPEHIKMLSSPQAAPAASIPAIVDNSEPMGSETFLYLLTGSHKLVARIPPTGRFEPDTATQLAFETEKAHLFDPQSQERITE